MIANCERIQRIPRLNRVWFYSGVQKKTSEEVVRCAWYAKGCKLCREPRTWRIGRQPQQVACDFNSVAQKLISFSWSGWVGQAAYKRRQKKIIETRKVQQGIQCESMTTSITVHRRSSSNSKAKHCSNSHQRHEPLKQRDDQDKHWFSLIPSSLSPCRPA